MHGVYTIAKDFHTAPEPLAPFEYEDLQDIDVASMIKKEIINDILGKISFTCQIQLYDLIFHRYYISHQTQRIKVWMVDIEIHFQATGH